MIKLYGFAVSNYYNMVKFALLEKSIAFEEVSAMPSQEADYRSKSPMGKVPCIETGQGFLSETAAILDYLDAIAPNPPLLPKDPYAAAKVREIAHGLELYIELQSRRHYAEIFFGEPRNAAAVTEARPIIEKGLGALKQLGKFKPYLAGEFSYADIVAAHTFIYAAPVCQAVYNWDIVAEVPGLKAAIDATNARPAGAKVMADQQAALQAFMASKG
jgi:glutathione S-transferase